MRRLVVLEVGLERHRVRGLPARDHLRDGGIDAAMDRQDVVVRLQEASNQMDGFVVDGKRAEKRLLSRQIVRRRASVTGAMPDGLRQWRIRQWPPLPRQATTGRAPCSRTRQSRCVLWP